MKSQRGEVFLAAMLLGAALFTAVHLAGTHIYRALTTEPAPPPAAQTQPARGAAIDKDYQRSQLEALLRDPR